MVAGAAVSRRSARHRRLAILGEGVEYADDGGAVEIGGGQGKALLKGDADGADGFRGVALALVGEAQGFPLLEQRGERQRLVRRFPLGLTRGLFAFSGRVAALGDVAEDRPHRIPRARQGYG